MKLLLSDEPELSNELTTIAIKLLEAINTSGSSSIREWHQKQFEIVLDVLTSIEKSV